MAANSHRREAVLIMALPHQFLRNQARARRSQTGETESQRFIEVLRHGRLRKHRQNLIL